METGRPKSWMDLSYVIVDHHVCRNAKNNCKNHLQYCITYSQDCQIKIPLQFVDLIEKRQEMLDYYFDIWITPTIKEDNSLCGRFFYKKKKLVIPIALSKAIVGGSSVWKSKCFTRLWDCCVVFSHSHDRWNPLVNMSSSLAHDDGDLHHS